MEYSHASHGSETRRQKIGGQMQTAIAKMVPSHLVIPSPSTTPRKALYTVCYGGSGRCVGAAAVAAVVGVTSAMAMGGE